MENTILDYLGGLRSTCTYINARSIKEMAKCWHICSGKPAGKYIATIGGNPLTPIFIYNQYK